MYFYDVQCLASFVQWLGYTYRRPIRPRSSGAQRALCPNFQRYHFWQWAIITTILTINDPYPPNIPLRKGGLTSFAGLLQELGLTDVWRLGHPHTKQYSCCSATYGSLSRIDLGLANNILLPLVVASEDGDRHISDHSSLWVTISLPTTAKRTCWKQPLLALTVSGTRSHTKTVEILYPGQSKLGPFECGMGYYQGIYEGSIY